MSTQSLSADQACLNVCTMTQTRQVCLYRITCNVVYSIGVKASRIVKSASKYASLSMEIDVGAVVELNWISVVAKPVG